MAEFNGAPRAGVDEERGLVRLKRKHESSLSLALQKIGMMQHDETHIMHAEKPTISGCTAEIHDALGIELGILVTSLRWNPSLQERAILLEMELASSRSGKAALPSPDLFRPVVALRNKTPVLPVSMTEELMAVKLVLGSFNRI
jgi:hypothetical protein